MMAVSIFYVVTAGGYRRAKVELRMGRSACGTKERRPGTNSQTNLHQFTRQFAHNWHKYYLLTTLP